MITMRYTRKCRIFAERLGEDDRENSSDVVWLLGAETTCDGTVAGRSAALAKRLAMICGAWEAPKSPRKRHHGRSWRTVEMGWDDFKKRRKYPR